VTAIDHGQPISHREALLREGMAQIFANGYHGTTVDGLLKATGVPKGSFYHHFRSKEAFTETILNRYGGFHRDRLTSWAARDLSTPAALSGYFRDLARIFVESGYRLGDLAGKLATEIVDPTDPLHQQIAEIVRQWRVQLESVLRVGQRRGDIRTDRNVHALSAGLHALIDGAFVVGMSTRNADSLESVATAIEHLVAVQAEG
jgi:TetR/AcrR family transcriptional repressor of nem operon